MTTQNEIDNNDSPGLYYSELVINRKYFFDTVRQSLFGGKLSQDQVDSIDGMLDKAEVLQLDDRDTAYIFATCYWETDKTMQAIAEYGMGAGKPYGVPDPVTGQTYYGRGKCQLTWKDNYQKQDDKLNLGGTLVANPDRALEDHIADQIMFGGMIDGDFTGKKLSQYNTADVTDFVNARQIINGNDHDKDIANIAIKFVAAIIRSPSTMFIS